MVESPMNSPEKVFTHLVDSFGWCPGHKGETPCGEGSYLDACAPIVQHLPEWFKTYGIKSVVDVGCGDFHWMRGINFDGMEYDGFDVVKKFVDELQKTHDKTNVRFHHADALEAPLPKADLYICKDVLNHYPVELGLRLLSKMRDSAKYFAALTFPGYPRESGRIALGAWWFIDLAQPPFNLGEPIASVPARETRTPKRVFALWKL